jgi:hypothetical protein
MRAPSGGAEHVTLQNYFSHPSLVIYFFPTPPIKLETGTANRWGTTNSKPSGPIIMFDQSKIGNSSQIKTNPFKIYSTPNSRIVWNCQAMSGIMIITLDKESNL